MRWPLECQGCGIEMAEDGEVNYYVGIDEAGPMLTLSTQDKFWLTLICCALAMGLFTLLLFAYRWFSGH